MACTGLQAARGTGAEKGTLILIIITTTTTIIIMISIMIIIIIIIIIRSHFGSRPTRASDSFASRVP